MSINKVKFYAKSMRNNPTRAERNFWGWVSKRQFYGLRFIRQHIFTYKEMDDVMHYYIVDFYCHEIKLIVEIDGGYHENPDQIALDELRTEILEAKGLRMIRFSNDEVIDNWDEVARRLFDFVKDLDDGSFFLP